MHALTTHCFNQRIQSDNKIPELQVCIAEALYDVDSIVADEGGTVMTNYLKTQHVNVLEDLT